MTTQEAIDRLMRRTTDGKDGDHEDLYMAIHALRMQLDGERVRMTDEDVALIRKDVMHIVKNVCDSSKSCVGCPFEQAPACPNTIVYREEWDQ